MDVKAIGPIPNGFGSGPFGGHNAKLSKSASEANGRSGEVGESLAASGHEISLLTEGIAAPTATDGPVGAATEGGGEGALSALQEEISSLVEAVNEKLQSMPETSIQFLVDSQSGEVIVQVVDSETDEVIRQVPPEEILQISERLDELKGLILDRRV